MAPKVEPMHFEAVADENPDAHALSYLPNILITGLWTEHRENRKKKMFVCLLFCRR